jgi:hypothetical protein
VTIASVTNSVGGTPLWSDPVWYINGSGLSLTAGVRTALDATGTGTVDATVQSVSDTQVVIQHNLPLTATSNSAALYTISSDGGGSGWFRLLLTPAPVVVEPGPTGPAEPVVTQPVTRPAHDPVVTEFTAGMAQVYTIPDWADALDIVAIGGGGGGQGGGALNSNGQHGDAGVWAGTTITIDPAGAKTLYVTVGSGGNGGPGPLKGLGTDGNVSVVTVGSTTLITALGGAKGATGALGGISDSPAVPPYTFNGVTYPGTPGGVTHDPPPSPAGYGVGGAGGDGNVVGGGNGGAGGPGHVWIRAYQTT